MATTFVGGQDSRIQTVSRVHHAPRVLVAAADSEERARLQKLLDGWGHPVETAADGAALFAELDRGEAVSIVILDSDLPGLNGATLLHQLQLQSARRRSWTIVLTAATDINSSRATGLWRGHGVDDLLAKPVDEFDLRVSLRAAARIQARCAEMAEAIDAARFHASHDSLTGLWNRESLLSLLFQETDRARRLGSPLAFLLLDLDQFARINREHGYDGGDRVLRQLASRFRRFLRSYDLAGRCGEDEFLIAMPGCSLEDARSMAARLRDCIAERPFDILQTAVTMTASFGIAQSHGRSPLAVLREAENALSSAKLAGGGCVRCFVPEPAPAPKPGWEAAREVRARLIQW